MDGAAGSFSVRQTKTGLRPRFCLRLQLKQFGTSAQMFSDQDSAQVI